MPRRTKPKAKPADAPSPSAASARRPTIVALGASAGGLAVFERFLHAMPRSGNLAFLLVSHLDPSQESLLTELLSQHTALTVVRAEDGARIQADHVYVIPPNKYMTVSDGAVQLATIRDERGSRFPIDVLLRSLAEDQRENAVGIIFTGTGADGTDGLRAIKDNGGTAIVQDPATVEYPGMPTSAIATGLVDFVLSVEEMPGILLGYARHFYAREHTLPEDSTTPEMSNDLRSVFSVLKASGDPLDYRAYKPGTLMRRIHRRMGLNQIDRISDYVALLRKDAAEVERLRNDLIITVTHFFRDDEAWKAVERDVIPALFKDRDPDAPVRVWVPGCSTGEEAYSIAMLLLEHRRLINAHMPIQVFATDLKSDVLDVARSALYDRSSVAHIPPHRLKEFFKEEAPNQFRATKELRETIAFAVQNLLSDPPFSRMDLVSCRNVLIYFQPEAQKKIVGLLHFALKPGGYLFLGGSEAATAQANELEAISKRWRIYRRIGKARAGLPELLPQLTPVFPVPPTGRHALAGRALPSVGARDARDPAELTQRWLVEAYAPAAVVIDPHDQVIYTHGAAEAYVKLPRGEPVLNLFSMVQPAFRARLRAALHKSRTTGERCELMLRQPLARGTTRVVRSRIQRLGDPSTGLTIVTFEDVPGRAKGHPATAEEESAVHQLEAELVATKADLQGTIEALETANEELRASNEEIMSMNEEFRSTNEELETSKEELQSLNEELSTVNNQLREKIQALELVTNDLTNLLASTDIPTLFLDTDLRIRRFTPASKAILSLIPSDLGRPLSDISLKFQDDSLLQDIRDVTHSLAATEKEIRTNDGRRYLRRIRPYRTHDNRIDGVVITFVDIERMKLAEDEVRAARRYAEGIVDTVREPLLVLDAHLRVKSANRAFYDGFRVQPDEVIGRSVYSLGEGQWGLPALRELLDRAMHDQVDVRDCQVEAEFGGLGKRTMLMNSRRFRSDVGEDDGRILLAIEDVTERVQAEESVRRRTAEMEEANRDLRHVNESLDAFSHVVGHDLKEPARAVELLLQMLQQDHATALPAPAQKLLADARAANERLSRLIMGLLALSRASRIDFPNLRAVGIREAIENESCRIRYEALLAARDGRIDAPAPDVFVHATPESLSQILGNLIVNALKHNPRPKPRVRVRVGPLKESGMVEVVVEDNGPGFPADLVGGFDEMSATTRGFGLIIVKRTVENLGGRMWLGKGEGGGAAVHFTLRCPVTPAA